MDETAYREFNPTPRAREVFENRLHFGRKMGFSESRTIGLIVDAIMERCFPPFAPDYADYNGVQVWVESQF